MSKSSKPLFKTIAHTSGSVLSYSDDALFFLEEDNWNDYGYYTTYNLHASKGLIDEKRPSLIGHLKILKKGQKIGESYLINRGTFNSLGEDYCSLGGNLDYYQRLAELDKGLSDRVLRALNDVVLSPDIRKEFEGEAGFQASLMRGRNSNDDIFEIGAMIIERNFREIFSIDLDIKFDMPELVEPIGFNFMSPRIGLFEKALPERIAVLIGRNGSGKSTILSRISRISSSLPSDRNETVIKNNIGTLLPESIGFTRVMVLSYSPFDSFNTPGLTVHHKKRIIEEMKFGLGAYIFCGIRNIIAELEIQLPLFKTDADGRLSDADIVRDRIETTILKSNQELGIEFVRNINIINSTTNRDFFEPVLELLREEQSLNSILVPDFTKVDEDQLLNFFKDLSTGHKFVIHAITSVVAYTAPRSLLLFDEPETHLHPPILAVMMKAIRFVLDKTNSSMVVATHSPVVLQETLWRHVFVVRRQGNKIKTFRPDLETFGENIGQLTHAAFGLSADITQYHTVLDDLVRIAFDEEFRDYSTENILSNVEKNFEKGLSMQARSYVLSQILNSKNGKA